MSGTSEYPEGSQVGSGVPDTLVFVLSLDVQSTVGDDDPPVRSEVGSRPSKVSPIFPVVSGGGEEPHIRLYLKSYPDCLISLLPSVTPLSTSHFSVLLSSLCVPVRTLLVSLPPSILVPVGKSLTPLPLSHPSPSSDPVPDTLSVPPSCECVLL